MSHGRASSTLRELRAHLSAPPVVTVQAGVALVLGLSGPFGTFEALSLPPRMIYWAAVVFGTYGIGAAFTLTVETRWPGLRLAPRIALTGALIGAAVTVLLLALGVALFGTDGLIEALATRIIPGAFVISWVVLALREVLLRHAPQPAPPRAASPAILQRLPLEKRGALVALSAEDHYVAVATSRGRELLLMRLSDAIAAAEGVAGLQVHRSHWVALDQIRTAERQGDGAMLTLSDGQRIPVSRSRLPAVRDAGLLPG